LRQKRLTHRAGLDETDSTVRFTLRSNETIDHATEKELVELLAQVPEGLLVDIHRVARFAVSLGCRAIVGYLVNSMEADLERKDVAGRSASFYAAAWDTPTMLEYMDGPLGGMDTFELWSKDVDGWTPLHYAALSNVRLENIEYCLDSGAELEAKTNDGETALDLLRKQKDLPWAKYAELLLTPEWKWESYEKFPGWAQSWSDDTFSTGFLMEDLKLSNVDIEVELDMVKSKITWIHIPWTNVRRVESTIRRRMLT
jgi:hypothetical protein